LLNPSDGKALPLVGRVVVENKDHKMFVVPGVQETLGKCIIMNFN